MVYIAIKYRKYSERMDLKPRHLFKFFWTVCPKAYTLLGIDLTCHGYGNNIIYNFWC